MKWHAFVCVGMCVFVKIGTDDCGPYDDDNDSCFILSNPKIHYFPFLFLSFIRLEQEFIRSQSLCMNA